MSPSPADPIPMQVRPACVGSEQGDPPPRGRAVAAEPRGETAVLPNSTDARTPPRGRAVASANRRDPAPSPPSDHKRRNESCDDPAAKRALTRGSERVPAFMDLSDRAVWPSLDGSLGAPAPDGPSQASPITDQPEQHAYENGFAHLLFEGISPDDLSDQAAKVNTWRNIPAR